MKKSLPFLFFGLFTVSSFAQNVMIPDANFKAYLVGNTAINTNLDSEIQLSEAAAFTGTINVFNNNISDLTGIESFTSLTQLNCTDNNLTSLNVSSNTMLTVLSASQNSLTSLDVSNNPNLTSLFLSFNSLTSLDVSNNTSLTLLWCHINQLTALDVSMLTQLTELQCNGNDLSVLDVSGLNSLNKLGCFNNNLTYLNVANGNNANFTQFNATNNPSLVCIQVDDSLYSATNWVNIDVTASFNENCGVNSLNENKLIEMTIYPNPTNNNLTISCEEVLRSVYIYDMNGKLIQQENQKQFSIEELSPGIYTILVTTDDGIFKDKLVKN